MENKDYNLELSDLQSELNHLMQRYVTSPIPTPSALVDAILVAQEKVSIALNNKETRAAVLQKKQK